MDAKERKQKAIEVLRRRVPLQAEQLAGIDARLLEYFRDLCEHSGTELGDPNDLHNVMELLGAVKFLRLLRTYTFNVKAARYALYFGEGLWTKDKNGQWKHVKDGIRQPGTTQQTVYRWQPWETLIFAWIYGFHAWIDTKLTKDDRAPLYESERVTQDGRIMDYRRLTTAFTLYTPRKTSKTGKSAMVGTLQFVVMGDHNGETYCCANAKDQSMILFNRIRGYVSQLDDGKRIRQNASLIDWRNAYKSVRDSSVRALSAGGKTKDGMFADTLLDDESGSSAWVNGHNDLFSLINVVASSMGPRRQPLQFSTTTAGTITSGFFIDKLDGLHRMLYLELDYEDGTAVPDAEMDRIGCILLEPDEWERDEEYVLTSLPLRKKVNPMLGVTVQHSFYDEWAAKARMEPEKMNEVMSKLFNVYVSGNTEEWVKPEKIRSLQVERRIDDCRAGDGWVTFCGMDFSQGDDLHAIAYLSARRSPVHGGTEFFADMDAWIKQDTLEKSSVRELYEPWIEKGWLHVSPGEVFQPSLPVVRIKQLVEQGVQFLAFGYDAYFSQDPTNMLKAYLAELGVGHPENYVVPVSQSFASYNPAVDVLSYCIKAETPLVCFSMNPLWPWCFGNAVLAEDRMENKKPLKRNGSDSCKVDPVQCLCSAFLLEMRYEGTAVKDYH